jgi:hypothetical protein
MLNSKIDTIAQLEKEGKTKKALKLTDSVLKGEELRTLIQCLNMNLGFI